MTDNELDDLLGTALHPLRGRLACVTVQVGHQGTPRTITAWRGPDGAPGPTADAWNRREAEMLEELRTVLGQEGVTRSRPGVLVGHNLKGFDLQWLYLRCLRAQHPLQGWLPWPELGGKPWSGGSDDRVHDTQVWLQGPGRAGRRLRLTETLGYLGLVAADADAGSGSSVARWWLEHQYHLIAEHCEVDVARCMALHAQVVGARRSPAGPYIGLDIETIPDPTHPAFTPALLDVMP